jgi:hypothetical protein
MVSQKGGGVCSEMNRLVKMKYINYINKTAHTNYTKQDHVHWKSGKKGNFLYMGVSLS